MSDIDSVLFAKGHRDGVVIQLTNVVKLLAACDQRIDAIDNLLRRLEQHSHVADNNDDDESKQIINEIIQRTAEYLLY